MCGIAGVYNYSGQLFEPSTLERMTHALEHRGPDDFGFSFIGPEVALRWRDETPQPLAQIGMSMGHRRLSILDLSEAGRQPFFSADGRYCMVYNGEVFNYVELRNKLKALGQRFTTGTDTEVVLAAYIQWGTDCFNLLNGMWALLIWDNQERKLVACRDRFGIKPLYYHHISGAVLFGSEAKAILQHESAIREPDVGSVVGYIARRAAAPGEASYFRDIHSVEPATWISFSADGRETSERYWSLPESRNPSPRTMDDAAEQLKELLTDSIRLRLRSDVKVGTMLSGGLDSTAVIAIVSKLMSTESQALAATGDSLHSFTAAFPNEAIDETAKVDVLCGQLPLTKHTVFPTEEGDLYNLLNSSAHAMEMPWFNSVPMVHSLLMRRAKAEGVTVVLNGHGADEVFAGYPYEYCAEAAADALLGMKLTRAWREMRGMKRNHGFKWSAAFRAANEQFKGRLKQLAGRGDAWAIDGLVHGELLRQNPVKTKQAQSARSGLDLKLRRDFFEHMLPSWLQFEDRISMASSIEARLPFMDYRVIEFGFNLPDELKISGGTTKAVLRKAMAGTLPSIINDDSKKTPFSGPGSHWLRGSLKPVVVDMLISNEPRIAQFVDANALKSMVNGFMNGHGDPSRIWIMLNTEAWLQSYFGSNWNGSEAA